MNNARGRITQAGKLPIQYRPHSFNIEEPAEFKTGNKLGHISSHSVLQVS